MHTEMDALTIRLARPEDVPAIAALEEICFQADPWPVEIIARYYDRFIVAMEGDALAGYAALSSILDEGNLDNIAVAPAYRRQGIGEALLKEILRRAREKALAVLYLEVRAGNRPAIALYEKHGFLEVGRRKNYYEKPREDAILMTLVL